MREKERERGRKRERGRESGLCRRQVVAGPPRDINKDDYSYYQNDSWDQGYSGPVVYYGGGDDSGCDGYGNVSQADR
jgi:hypothetical protein